MTDERERSEPERIENLLPGTIEGVANRLLSSHSFHELVYRESEMDALFTLVDIAIKTARHGNTIGPAPEPGALVASPDLYAMRDLIFAAHDLTHDDQVVEAARLLREAAAIARSWS
jgi:hypothetical protein